MKEEENAEKDDIYFQTLFHEALKPTKEHKNNFSTPRGPYLAELPYPIQKLSLEMMSFQPFLLTKKKKIHQKTKSINQIKTSKAPNAKNNFFTCKKVNPPSYVKNEKSIDKEVFF